MLSNKETSVTIEEWKQHSTTGIHSILKPMAKPCVILSLGGDSFSQLVVSRTLISLLVNPGNFLMCKVRKIPTKSSNNISGVSNFLLSINYLMLRHLKRIFQEINSTSLCIFGPTISQAPTLILWHFIMLCHNIYIDFLVWLKTTSPFAKFLGSVHYFLL